MTNRAREFFGNTLRLSMGNVAAQVINLLTIPIITRLYGPDEFGQFAIIMSVIALAIPFTHLAYPVAIVLSGSNRLALSMLLFSLLVSMVAWVLLTGVLYGTFASVSMDIPIFVAGLALTILLLESFYSTLSYHQIRHRGFRAIGLSRVVQSVTDCAAAIGGGLFFFGSFVMLVVSRLLAVACALAVIVPRDRGVVEGLRSVPLSRRRIAFLALRFRKLPFFSLPSVFLNKGAVEFPLVLVGWLFSAPMAGAYALCARVVNLPMQLLGDGVAKVFFQQAAAMKKEPDALRMLSLRLFEILLVMALFVSLNIYAFGPELVSVIFGPDWESAGSIVGILGFAYLAGFVARPLSTLYDVLERQRVRMFYDAALFCVRAGALAVVAVLTGEFLPAILAMVLCSVFVHLSLAGNALWLCGNRPKMVMVKILGTALIMLPLVMMCLVVRYDAGLPGGVLILIAVFANLAQLAIVLVTRRDLRTAFMQVVQ